MRPLNKLETAGKTCCRLAESLQKFPKNHSHHDLPLQECSPHNMAEGNKENIERRIRKSSSTGEWNETCRAHNIPRRKTHSIQRVGKKESKRQKERQWGGKPKGKRKIVGYTCTQYTCPYSKIHPGWSSYNIKEFKLSENKICYLKVRSFPFF